MEKNEDRVTWKEVLGIVIATASLGAAAFCGFQMYKTRKMVTAASKHVKDLTEVTIQDSIVENAVKFAADCEATKSARRVAKAMEADISSQVTKKVNEAIAQNYSKIKSGVAETVAKKVVDIDTHDILEEATEKAKEMLLSKFDGKLDGLMTDYQRNLDNVGKIYQSIAASMADKAGKDVTLKLG